MRRLVVTEFITLDGVVEAPDQWSFPYWGDDIGKFKFDELFSADSMLLGRVTYEGFAAAWPSMTDEEGFADRMNAMPKLVASKTLTETGWNAEVAKGSIVDEVATLKQRGGNDILVAGSPGLAQTLIEHNLVDEYRLLVYPIVVGSGKRLFQEGRSAKLALKESKRFASGATLMTYTPAPK